LKAADSPPETADGSAASQLAYRDPRPTGAPWRAALLDAFVDAALEAEVWALDARLGRAESALVAPTSRGHGIDGVP
jgi:hypothetical protein